MCALVDLEPGVKQTPSFWLTQIRFPGVMFYRGLWMVACRVPIIGSSVYCNQVILCTMFA